MGFLSSLAGNLTGGLIGTSSQERAAKKAAGAQKSANRAATAATTAATAEAQGFLSPFGIGTPEQPGIGQRGLDLSSFIANPQEQFDFLQGNPLFDLALENANRQTQQSAAASGRLSAGDTLQQLSNNVLLQASPLIRNQTADIFNLLGIGQQGVTSQANAALGLGSDLAGLASNRGDISAAEQVALGNARAGGVGQTLGLIAPMLSGSAFTAATGTPTIGGAGTSGIFGGGQTPGGFGAGAGGGLINPTAGLLPLPF